MRPTTQQFLLNYQPKNANLFATPNSWVPFQRFKISQLFQLCSSAIEVYLSRYNLKMRSRATSSTLVRLENFNTSGNFGNSLLIEMSFWRFWIQFNFTLRNWKCQSPPWLSRWRKIRRVLIHTIRRANGNGNETGYELRTSKMLRNYRRRRTRVRYYIPWDPEFKPYW